MAICLFCYKDAGEQEYHARCSQIFFGTPDVPVLSLDAILLKRLAQQATSMHIAVTGVQPKISVILQKAKEQNRLTIAGLWGEYILKPQQDRFIALPENEDLTMHLAAVFKINTCAHTLIKTTEGNFVYLAKRFDRAKGKKIHVEDLCQLSGFLTENKYKGSYEKAGKLIALYCTNTGLDTIDYFELVLFCYLTGNNDMHLKNFSVIHKENAIALSPAYDLLSVNLANPKDDEELALTLNGKKKKFKLADFATLANSIGIHAKAMQNSFTKFTSKNHEVKQLIDSSFLQQEQKEMYWQIWLQKQKIFK